MQRIGIYSGTFDPVHAGHVAFAVESLHACQLDTVVFLPEHQPRGKVGVTRLADRLELLRLATAEDARLQIASLDQTQFSVGQTLPSLKAMFPQAELTLLIGSDVVMGLPHWPDLQMLCQQVSFAIGLRATETRQQVQRVMDELAQKRGLQISCDIVTTAYSHHNSSAVRQARPTLPEIATVRDYIRDHELYPDRHFREAT